MKSATTLVEKLAREFKKTASQASSPSKRKNLSKEVTDGLADVLPSPTKVIAFPKTATMFNEQQKKAMEEIYAQHDEDKRSKSVY